VILAAGLSPAWQQIMRFDRFLPGEVNRASEVHWCASGKVLNVGLALAHLDAPCSTLTVLGGPPAARIEQEFAELGAPLNGIKTAAPTRTCTTILDAQTGQTTELVENAGSPTEAELADFVAAFRQQAAAATTVVLTGSLPRGTPATFYRDLLADWPVRAILDVRGPELLAALERKPLLVKPNREELAMTVGRPVDSDERLLGAMREINQRGAIWVVVSQGKDALWLTSLEKTYQFTPPNMDVVNPIGCGDCLAAGMAWRLDAGDDVPQAVRYGMAAAAENAAMLLPSRLDAALVQRRAAEVKWTER
jgi:1-phosphofructokinase family hexose kinase